MTVLIRLLAATCIVLLLTTGSGYFARADAASKKLKQQKSENASATWSKTFTTFNNYRAAVIATSDGGYLMTGSKGENARDNGSSLWLMKTDSRGAKIWEKIFSPHKSSPHHGYAAIETSDGYLVTGTKNLSALHGWSTWNELWIIKLSKKGTTLWEKSYGCQWGADTSAGEGHSILQTNDGGLIIAGFGSVGGTTTAWLLRLDRNGIRQWEKFLGPADNGGGASPVSLAKAADGHFYAAFTTPDEHAVFFKVDADGSPGWHKTFGKNQQGRSAGLSDVTETKDNGLIATGGISMGKAVLWILLTDNRGNVVWNKEMTDKRLSTGYAVVQASDGGYVVCGRDDKGVAVWLLKLDAAGTIGK